MTVRILAGDVRDKLRELPDESVHCVVTSPPYFGLRDYGVAGQIGLEPSPAEYVEALVAVFREVRRVLRKDGTLWLNLGDSYAGSWGNQGRKSERGTQRPINGPMLQAFNAYPDRQKFHTGDGIKPKDLLGIPWRVAFALQADGWWLRQDIIWLKPNPMPESVTDRCTKAHEYLFLLSKSERYYFDAAAIAEEMAAASIERLSQPTLAMQAGSARVPGKTNGPMKAVGSLHMQGTQRNDGERWRIADGGVAPRGNRNKRSVWEIATTPYSEAHFATFPPALVEPCILAGSPRGGVVIDPFGGAGTTALVADRLGRDAILVELNPAYAAMARRRIVNDAPLFADVAD